MSERSSWTTKDKDIRGSRNSLKRLGVRLGTADTRSTIEEMKMTVNLAEFRRKALA